MLRFFFAIILFLICQNISDLSDFYRIIDGFEVDPQGIDEIEQSRIQAPRRVDHRRFQKTAIDGELQNDRIFEMFNFFRRPVLQSDISYEMERYH